MNFLIIDGNSIINRAFYGIKMLTTKDGHYTNAIYGFLNIMLSLTDTCSPDAVAVAFDVKQPTFRHKMYDAYKAGRKAMPAELFEQMEPLKEILSALGCHIIECPGYEADDILGTLSAACPEKDHCYIATGDRDSLQLVKDNVSVLLTTTKMGKTQTVEYTPEFLYSEYGVTPSGMIEIKALQGDSSDNIPGVAGIGPKTAGDLIKKYGNIDKIYEDVDAVSASDGVKNKLKADKDNAYLSRTLGTINLSAPVETDISLYIKNDTDTDRAIELLSKYEMFKLISRLGLKTDSKKPDIPTQSANTVPTVYIADYDDLKTKLEKSKKACFICEINDNNIDSVLFNCDNEVYIVTPDSMRFNIFIKELFENPEIGKYTPDTKILFTYCDTYSIKLNNIKLDTTLAAYLINPNSKDYSVSTLALDNNVRIFEPLNGDDAAGLYILAHPDIVKDASVLELLCTRLMAAIEANGQEELLYKTEIPLAHVLSSMEREGIMADSEGISLFGDKLAAKIETLKADIYLSAGFEFNLNSPKQLGEALFEKMGIKGKKKTKSGYSTSAEVLEELAGDYPIVSKILEYRTFTKLKSTYCDGLLKVIDNDSRIHSTFNQTETRTGRLSSTEPNLQNIPVRTELGREMRKFFRAKNGFVIVDADYSQIELRVLAAVSKDKNMIDAFNDGTDIHAVTASKVFGVPLNEVTHELRSKAKAVNFGIVYGIGAFSLAKNTGSTRSEAESFINAYFALYSGVESYMKDSITVAKQKGYAETLLHRRRYLPELSSSNHMMRAFGERVARNMPIQGTAADIIKIAMIKVYRRLYSEYPEAKLIMQVHDELMIEAPETQAEAIAALLKEEMENAVNLDVKLSVDVSYGKTWYDAKS